MESNESCSEEQLVQHKEKDLQTLLKIKEYTQEILEQLKLRIKTYDKYEKILTGKQKYKFVSIFTNFYFIKTRWKLYPFGDKFLILAIIFEQGKNMLDSHWMIQHSIFLFTHK